jgi:hypothetical protein
MATRTFCWVSTVCSLARIAFSDIVNIASPAATTTADTTTPTINSIRVTPRWLDVISRAVFIPGTPTFILMSHSGETVVVNVICFGRATFVSPAAPVQEIVTVTG